MSSAALLGREESDSDGDAPTTTENIKPFEMAALKARAFRITKKERKGEGEGGDNDDGAAGGPDVDPASASRRGSKSKKIKKKKQPVVKEEE